MDSFYPSVEKREDTSLNDKPVIVTIGPNEGRGVVTSCSYEARKYGVKSGMALQIARKLCPNAIYLPANFELYRETSERIMHILEQFTEQFEKVSIDEAYLDISNVIIDYKDAKKIALKIKKVIKSKEKITCSIGIAPNKIVAKIASGFNKPNGLTIVSPKDIKKFLEPLSVKKLPGIGKKTEVELKKLGIITIKDIADSSKVLLVEKFGKNGVWMWDAANGIDESPVEERGYRKSISTQRTLLEDIDEWNKIVNSFSPLIEEVLQRADEESYDFRTLGIMLTFDNFKKVTREKTLHLTKKSQSIIEEYVKQLLEEFRPEHRKIRRIGLKISNLMHKEKNRLLLDDYM